MKITWDKVWGLRKKFCYGGVDNWAILASLKQEIVGIFRRVTKRNRRRDT